MATKNGVRNKAAHKSPEYRLSMVGSGAQTILPSVRAYQPDVDLATLSLDELSTSQQVYNRELSWLDFCWRVLHEGLDARTPLLERVGFLAITSSILDEFFLKRVGGLKRQQAVGLANLTLQGWTPDFQLQLIAKAVRPLIETHSRCFLEEIIPALESHDIRIMDYDDLNERQKKKLQQYYQSEVYPLLTPLAVDPGHPFPFISNLSLNLGVMLYDRVSDESRFARVKIPVNRPRWVPLDHPQHFVPLEQIIFHNLDTLFRGMDIVAAHPFRITRNADLDRNEEEAEDLLELISEELRERRFAPAVRLEVAESMPENMLAILQSELEVENTDIYHIRGLLGLDNLTALAGLNLPHLKYEPWAPQTPARFANVDAKSRPGEMFALIRQNEHLVHHPYYSFTGTTQQFLEAAARDPQVLAIKQTLYRTGSDSPVVNALIQAAERGKQVAVLVEVKARFDEERNIEWAHVLEDAGCHVAYGLVGLKTHSKLSLVIRQEEDGLRAYVHLGTGNYNPKTASFYTDLGFFSCDPNLTSDVMELFNSLTGYSRQTQYRKLLVAPVNMRQQFIGLIDNEIRHALAGRRARIIAKMNALDDSVLVRKLYEASQAGVSIDLLIRGNCRVRAGLPGVSENIRVLSIIGRFLEHARIYYFENNGDPLYYIGSADWMQRNLSSRVEAITPITEPRLCEQLNAILQLSLTDYRQSWEMLPDGRYRQRCAPEGESALVYTHGVQVALMQQARTTTNPV